MVEHWSVESEGLRFDSSWGLRIFSLSHAHDKTKFSSNFSNPSRSFWINTDIYIIVQQVFAYPFPLSPLPSPTTVLRNVPAQLSISTLNMLSFAFVSRCSHVWCRSRRSDCILLVFFRRWGRLVMRDLIKHDALLWLVVFQQLWLVHFDPCCSLGDLLPRWSDIVSEVIFSFTSQPLLRKKFSCRHFW